MPLSRRMCFDGEFSIPFATVLTFESDNLADRPDQSYKQKSEVGEEYHNSGLIIRSFFVGVIIFGTSEKLL